MRYSSSELTGFLSIVVLLAGVRPMLAKEPAAGTLPDVADLASQSESPNSLVMLNGERVSNKEQWIKGPELGA